MSPNKHPRRRELGRPLAVCAFALALIVAAVVGIAVSGGSSVGSGAPAIASVDRELAPAEQQMLAQSQRFSPGDVTTEGGEGSC